MHIKHFYAASIAALTLNLAHAHHLWLEPEGNGISLRFGEYGDNLKEISPGLLDRVPSPDAFIIEGALKKPITAIKGKDGFSLAAPITANGLTAEVRNYPLRELKQGEHSTRSKWVAAARYVYSYAPQAPVTLFDLVPDGAPGKFKIFFRGKALAQTKVTLIAPNGWQREATSNAKGEIEIKPRWKGVYVLEAAYKTNAPGDVDGEHYDTATFTSTVTFTYDEGSPTERPAPATPNTLPKN